MKDEAFIKSILAKGNDAKEKVRVQFSTISLQQLNWKPSPKAWSIGQCLEHLIISDSLYFPALKKITEGHYRLSFWERYSPFTTLCGNIMKDRLQEDAKKKMIAPGKIRPASSEIKAGIMDQYQQNLDTFLEYISNCVNVDLDKIIITSPIMQIVTYSLRDALYFLIRHEHRHINQAVRVKANENFPR